MQHLYLFYYLSALGAWLYNLHRAGNWLRLIGFPIWMGRLLLAFLFSYLPPLATGAMGLFVPWITWAVWMLVQGGAIVYWAKFPPMASPTGADAPRPQLPNWGILLVVCSVACLFPIVLHVAHLPKALFAPDHFLLNWDTAVYHFPGMVEIAQKQTLWTFDNVYQSYVFGFEMTGIFFASLFHQHWPFLIVHEATLLFFALLLWQMSGAFQKIIPMKTPQWALFLTIVGFWSILFVSKYDHFGKNDLFNNTMVLLAAWIGFQLLLRQMTDNHRPAWLALMGAALALAMASKPTALAYWVLLLGILFWQWPSGLATWRQALSEAAFVFIVSILLGGFFYFRNLTVFGALTDPALSGAFLKSLLANWNSPTVWRLGAPNLVWFATSALLPIVAAVGLLRKPSSPQERIWMIRGYWALFFGAAWATFLITPYVLHRTTPDGPVEWMLRLGMPLFTLFACWSAWLVWQLGALIAPRLGAWWVRSHQVTLFSPTRLVSIGSAILLSGYAFLPIAWHLHLPINTLGYQQIGKHSTSAYAWLRQQTGDVYAVNLLPYSLYGVQWEKRVFHEGSIFLEKEKECRLTLVLQQFAPRWVAVGLANGLTPNQLDSQLADWLARQPYLREAYRDELGVVFEVVGSPPLLGNNCPNVQQPVKMSRWAAWE